MGKIEITLPAMGEGIIEATITRWFVREGEYIHEDDPLLEVATDKVDSEIPSPYSGTINQIFYHEGEIPKVGEVLVVIESDILSDTLNTDTAALNENSSITTELPKPASKPRISSTPLMKNDNPTIPRKEMILSPYVRFIARDRGISTEELKQIEGSGLNNRITREDLNNYIISGRPFKNNHYTQILSVGDKGTKRPTPEEKKFVAGEGEELIEMDRTRKLIADHMVQSKRVSPHVTSMVEIDVTELVVWREKHKAAFMKKHGIKLTYTPVIVEAAVQALKKYPGINISVSGDYIIQKKYINIGVATALPDGNLIVPVIRDADKRSFPNIAIDLVDLAGRAREGKLSPNEARGGTFTITNMGQYDNVSGTPIINQPEVAILAVGAIKKKPSVVNFNNELTVGIRDIMVLSLTYDHRVVDGALGGSFVREIGHYLETTAPEF
jgi:2-oxoglutarate dehydrogenase E2 component (dihydrolipoamide succinyltransferase)